MLCYLSDYLGQTFFLPLADCFLHVWFPLISPHPSHLRTGVAPLTRPFCFPGLHEFEAQKNHEVDEFRAKMRTFCEEKAQERQVLPWLQWMECNFPCELEPCCSPVECGGVKSKNTKIFINVKFEASDVSLLLHCFLNCLQMLFILIRLYGTALTNPQLWE